MAKAIAVADEQSTGMERFKSQPQRLMEFLKDVRAEMRKVITPTRAEVSLPPRHRHRHRLHLCRLLCPDRLRLRPGRHQLIQYLTKTLGPKVQTSNTMQAEKAHSPWR